MVAHDAAGALEAAAKQAFGFGAQLAQGRIAPPEHESALGGPETRLERPDLTEPHDLGEPVRHDAEAEVAARLAGPVGPVNEAARLVECRRPGRDVLLAG